MLTRKEQIEDELYRLAFDSNLYYDEIERFLESLPQNEETVEALVSFIKSGIDGCYEVYEILFSDRFLGILKEKGEFDCIYRLARKTFDCDFEEIL